MIEPMLGKLSVRDDSDCYWEKKFDGVRVIAFVDGKNISLQARSGTDKTTTFPELRIETKKKAILDGEVVSESGAFSSIQRRVNRIYDIELASKLLPVRYEVFDILEVDGVSCMHEPLHFRKQRLEVTLVKTDNVSPTRFTEDRYSLWKEAMEGTWEGIMGKKKNSIYEEGKRRWLKLKMVQEANFIVVGYTRGTGKREPSFGSLVLTDLNGKYVGQVGTGFDDLMIEELMKSMVGGDSPFQKEPIEATWIRPFGVKVKFLEYTNDGILRFPAFKELI